MSKRDVTDVLHDLDRFRTINDSEIDEFVQDIYDLRVAVHKQAPEGAVLFTLPVGLEELVKNLCQLPQDDIEIFESLANKFGQYRARMPG